MTRDRIDVHTHYLGGTVRDFLAGPAAAVTGKFRLGEWSPTLALDLMDRYEIRTQMLSVPIFPPPGRADASMANRFARQVNEELAGLVKDNPDHFGAFASVPLHDSADATLAELGYALDTLNLDGVTLPSNTNGRYFGDPFYEPILAELARRRTPVFVHPVDCPHIDELGFGRPSSVIEFPFDTARNVVNGIFRGVFRRYRDLTLILAHAGGALPTLGWRIAAHAPIGSGPDDVPVDAAHVAEVLHALHYDVALAGSRNSLLPTLEVTDSSRLLFGTDWPAAPEPVIEQNIAELVGFDRLTEDEQRAVDRQNAARLFPRLA